MAIQTDNVHTTTTCLLDFVEKVDQRNRLMFFVGEGTSNVKDFEKA